MAKNQFTKAELQARREQDSVKVADLRENSIKVFTSNTEILGNLAKEKAELQQLQKYYSIFKQTLIPGDKTPSYNFASDFGRIDSDITEASAQLKTCRTDCNNIQKDLDTLEGKGFLNKLKQSFIKDGYFTTKYKDKTFPKITAFDNLNINKMAKKVFGEDKKGRFTSYMKNTPMHAMEGTKALVFSQFLKASAELGDLNKDRAVKAEKLSLTVGQGFTPKDKDDIKANIKLLDNAISQKEKEIRGLADKYKEAEKDIRKFPSSRSGQPDDYVKKYNSKEVAALPGVSKPLAHLNEPVAGPNSKITAQISSRDLNSSVKAAQELHGKANKNDIEVSNKPVRAAPPTPYTTNLGRSTDRQL